ncbi:MAG TPA: alpha/beta hydrolase [Candidatus Sulfotelmatobacter sp.]|nr:alpha/beta hydrolase [Candidatus Sulfotelmatobacter sp.]HKN71629.1 alpha/beta hydrolase [Terriglobales bacterium]
MIVPIAALVTPSCQFQFTSTDGLAIACARWDARGPVRGVVQIAHGMGEHIGRYGGLIEVLVESGLIVYGNDHRGHGRTAPYPQAFGDFGEGGFRLLAEDIFHLTLIAKKENPGKPLILLGHSMGSFAAQLYAIDHSRDIAGLALSGSGALDGLARVARSAHRGQDNILNQAFQPARTPFDWLSRDTSVVDAFMSDPLCFATLQPLSNESFLAAASILADPASLRKIRSDLPIYLLSGSDDPVGQRLEGLRILIERYRAVGVQNISHDFYPGGRHEMLNEMNRAEVRANLLRWISSVLERHISSEAS